MSIYNPDYNAPKFENKFSPVVRTELVSIDNAPVEVIRPYSTSELDTFTTDELSLENQMKSGISLKPSFVSPTETFASESADALANHINNQLNNLNNNNNE